MRQPRGERAEGGHLFQLANEAFGLGRPVDHGAEDRARDFRNNFV